MKLIIEKITLWLKRIICLYFIILIALAGYLKEWEFSIYLTLAMLCYFIFIYKQKINLNKYLDLVISAIITTIFPLSFNYIREHVEGIYLPLDRVLCFINNLI